METINNNIQIILAEDNKTTADLTINAFRKSKVENEIVHLSDGEEVLNFIFNSIAEVPEAVANPKVILLDLKMPKINGMQVLDKLKSTESTKHFPIIILSSSDLESDIHQCYELGANSYIVKPIDFMDFIKTIKQLSQYWLTLNRVIN